MILRIVMCVALAVLPVVACAAPDLMVAQSPHFRIYSAEDPAKLRIFAENLERYDGVLRRLTAATAKEVVPLTIYVMADQNEVGDGSTVIGFYQPVAAGAYAVVPRKIRGFYAEAVPRIVLFHEYAHHFILQNFPAFYSPWFVEGSAEFYSTIEFTGNMAAVGKPEPLRIRGLMSPWRSPLPYLFAPGNRALTDDQTSELYSRAWLLVHYLTLSNQRGGQIDAYLQARSGGKSEEMAFQSAFGTSVAGMDKELKEYFAKRQLPFTSLDAPETAPITIRPATTGEAVLAKFTPRLRSLQITQEEIVATVGKMDRRLFDNMATRLAIDIRGMARKYPDDAAVQEIVAESELVAGHIDAARDLATKAVQLQPGNARAHLVLAAITLSAQKPDDAANLGAARKEIVLANRADPDDPMPLIAYYRSFADHGLTPPALAVKGLERAQQLAPQDDQIRLMLAQEAIKVRRYDRATVLLRSVAFAPHSGAHRDAALKLLASIPELTAVPSTKAPQSVPLSKPD